MQKKPIKANRRGFITNNNTQDMSKREKPKLTGKKSGSELQMTGQAQEIPSGEQGLPSLH